MSFWGGHLVLDCCTRNKIAVQISFPCINKHNRRRSSQNHPPCLLSAQPPVILLSWCCSSRLFKHSRSLFLLRASHQECQASMSRFCLKSEYILFKSELGYQGDQIGISQCEYPLSKVNIWLFCLRARLQSISRFAGTRDYQRSAISTSPQWEWIQHLCSLLFVNGPQNRQFGRFRLLFVLTVFSSSLTAFSCVY